MSLEDLPGKKKKRVYEGHDSDVRPTWNGCQDGPTGDYEWPNQLRVGIELNLDLLLESMKGVKV